MGNAGIDIFTDIRVSVNSARKKRKEEHLRLTCYKVKYRMRNQIGASGTFAMARFILLPHTKLFIQGE